MGFATGNQNMKKKFERQVIFVSVPLKADILKSLYNLD